MQTRYSIYEAKTKLSSLLKKVRKGDEVIIADRGTPVAKLVFIPPENTFAERMSRFASSGIVFPAKRKKIVTGVKKPGALSRFLEERE